MSMKAVYRWPLIVALAIALGLTAALTGDGVARVISWIALAFPIGVIAACLAAASRKQGASSETRGELGAMQQ